MYNLPLQKIIEWNYFDVSYLNLPDRNLAENSQQTLTLLHVNLRSINNFQNFDAFKEFLTDLSFSPDIECVSKTRLKGEPLINISIPNYKFAHADSIQRRAGLLFTYPLNLTLNEIVNLKCT